jgi:ankyrin repeat protein
MRRLLLCLLLTASAQSEPLINLKADRQSLSKILADIAAQAKVRIEIVEPLRETWTCQFRNLTLEECLESLRQEHQLQFQKIAPDHYRLRIKEQNRPSELNLSLLDSMAGRPEELAKKVIEPKILQQALKTNNLEAVSKLLALGAPATVPDADGNLPTWQAATDNCPRILAKLIEHGAPIQWQRTSYGRVEHLVLQELSIEVLEILRKAGGDLHVADEYGQTLLHGRNFSADDNYGYRDYLLTLDLPVNAEDSQHWTALDRAVVLGSGYLDFAKGLVARGADYTTSRGYNYSPVEISARCNYPLLEFLLEKGVSPNFIGKDGKTLLHHAADFNQLSSLKLLISRGAAIDVEDNGGHSPTFDAYRNLRWAEKYLLEKHKHASEYGDALSRVGESSLCYQWLLEHGGRVERAPQAPLPKDGGFALCLDAIQDGDRESLERLIQRGANFRTGSTSTVAVACRLEFWDLAVRLIELGADPNGTDDNGYRPLDHAVGEPVQVKRLLDHGSDPNSPGPEGFRPIHYACRAGDLESLRLLLAAGADPDCKTSEGKSAVQLVQESKLENAPRLLELLAQAKRLPARKSGP